MKRLNSRQRQVISVGASQALCDAIDLAVAEHNRTSLSAALSRSSFIRRAIAERINFNDALQPGAKSTRASEEHP